MIGWLIAGWTLAAFMAGFMIGFGLGSYASTQVSKEKKQ